MTAISWLCRQRYGFELAADGLSRYVAETPEEENSLPEGRTDEQKIFLTKFNGRDIAYAFTGTVCNRDRTFSLVEESRRILMSIGQRNVSEYVREFSLQAKAAFEAAKQDGRFQKYVSNPYCPDSSEPNVVARVFFAGYFLAQQPSFGIVTLQRDEQILLTPEIRIETPPEKDYLIGALGIASRIYAEGNHWVKMYARPVSPDGSLDQLASLAEGFIRACSDPRATEVDPSCRAIGGNVQLLEITPSGCRWRTPPVTS